MLGVHLRTWPGVLSDTSLAVIMHAERGGLPPPSWLCRRRSAARRGVPAELCSNNAIAVRICATVTYAFCTDHSNMKAWVRFTTRRTMSAVKSKFQNTFCCYYHYQVLGYFWTSRPNNAPTGKRDALPSRARRALTALSAMRMRRRRGAWHPDSESRSLLAPVCSARPRPGPLHPLQVPEAATWGYLSRFI